MLKIDIHTHILPPEIPRFKDQFGQGNFIHLHHGADGCTADMVDDNGRFFRQVKKNCFDPASRLAECDQSGVDIQVLSTVPVMFNYDIRAADGQYIAKALNDHLAGVVRENPKRFIGLGTLPMQESRLARAELVRCMDELGLAGVQIGSHIHDRNLSDKAFFDIFEAAESLGAAIFVHPWDMMGQKRMPDYWLPWLVGMPAESSLAICSMIFGGVFERFPKLRVAFAHGGGSFPMTVGRIEHGFKVRPDLCAVDNPIGPRKYLGHFWLDSLVHDAAALDYLIDLVGADRVCLGSDYPFPLGEQNPGELIASRPYSEEVKRQLYSEAALAWLGGGP